jgi:DNA-binding beta-propeller fold protein YncE
MDETELRTLFQGAVSAGRPSPQLVGNSVRAGRRLRKRRRIEAAAASVSAVALISILAPLASGALSGHQPSPTFTTKPGPTAYVWTATGARGINQRLGDFVTPVRLGTDTPLKPIRVPGLIDDVAAAPDGGAVYVFSFTVAATAKSEADYLTRINTATNQATKPIRLPGDILPDLGIQIAPDGRVAYVTYAAPASQPPVAAINLATGAVRYLAHPSGQSVFTPNGRFAYELTFAGVEPVDLATGKVLPTIEVRGHPQALAMARDGQAVYVVSQNNVQTAFVTRISTATNTAGTPIEVPTQTGGTGIVITPDSKTAYVNGDQYITPIDLSTGKALRTITLPASFRDQGGYLSMSPNGEVAYDDLQPIDVITNRTLPAVVLPRGYADSTVPAIPGFDPSGKTIYLAAVTSGRGQPQEGVLIPISTATQRQAGKIINVGPGSPQQIVIVP